MRIKILMFVSGCLSILYCLLGTNMITSQTRSTKFAPNRFINYSYIMNRTSFFTQSTGYTAIRCKKRLGGNLVFIKQRINNPALKARPTTFPIFKYIRFSGSKKCIDMAYSRHRFRKFFSSSSFGSVSNPGRHT